jgi:putative IMPACT (imprinted ancient) family translation regulator
MPIYNILDYKKLDNRLIAVVRYFGGTKLGAGLLTRTYSEAAKKVVEETNQN